MKITVEEVEHVAKLSRLTFSPEETALFTRQLDNILGYVDKLNELDTTGIEPTSHVLPIKNVFKVDEARPSLTPDEALSNAPERSGDFYRVLKILNNKASFSSARKKKDQRKRRYVCIMLGPRYRATVTESNRSTRKPDARPGPYGRGVMPPSR
jgi:aspartyl-tRNA(Asn)/glutamyl-tRNA(Gln) amidotransferase subunit C